MAADMLLVYFQLPPAMARAQLPRVALPFLQPADVLLQRCRVAGHHSVEQLFHSSPDKLLVRHRELIPADGMRGDKAGVEQGGMRREERKRREEERGEGESVLPWIDILVHDLLQHLHVVLVASPEPSRSAGRQQQHDETGAGYEAWRGGARRAGHRA
eukprot:747907-Hanusia_phi.AAC.4